LDGKQDCAVVLLPIRPHYAEPIIDGRKLVEFRKASFRARPSHVVVYASSPVQRVLGFFSVTDVEVAPVGDLWSRYGHVGEILENDFAAYFNGHECGVALSVGEVVALEQPLSLDALGLGSRPPQSFAYVSASVLDLMRKHCAAAPRDQLAPASDTVLA
jgi:predicted transcriptional regulator